MKLKIPETLTRQAYRRIREGILRAELGNGQRLTEGHLAQALGISKSPVREAMTQLEADGLVHILPRRGAYVRSLSATDVREIYELREALEEPLVRSLRLEPAAEARLHRCIATAAACLERHDRAGYIRADIEFHTLLVQCNANGRLRQVLKNLYSQMRLLRARTYELSARRSLRQHREILHALEQGEQQRAGRLMAHHIASVRERLLASFETPQNGKARTDPRHAASRRKPAKRPQHR